MVEKDRDGASAESAEPEAEVLASAEEDAKSDDSVEPESVEPDVAEDVAEAEDSIKAEADEADGGEEVEAVADVGAVAPTVHHRHRDGDEPDESVDDGRTIVADGIGLRSRTGWVFRHVHVSASGAEVVAVVGPAGSGRSTLLLALAARLKVDIGSVRVLGVETGRRRAPRSVLRRVAMVQLAHIVELDEALTVMHNARDAADWAGARRTEAADLLEDWRQRTGLAFPPDRPVGELGAFEQLALVLCLAQVGDPEIVVVDDIEAALTATERDRAWELVRLLADRGPTVVVGALDPPQDADQIIVLGEDPSAESTTGDAA